MQFSCSMYKLTRSPRWRHSHEKHGERLIDEEILETFIIDGDTEDLSNVAREHDKPILVKEYYRKSGIRFESKEEEDEEHAVKRTESIFTLVYIGDWDW